ncbi:MAG: hypothetical protein ACRDQ6_05485 [Pseudonocardiaceae bacterium]
MAETAVPAQAQRQLAVADRRPSPRPIAAQEIEVALAVARSYLASVDENHRSCTARLRALEVDLGRALAEVHAWAELHDLASTGQLAFVAETAIPDRGTGGG